MVEAGSGHADARANADSLLHTRKRTWVVSRHARRLGSIFRFRTRAVSTVVFLVAGTVLHLTRQAGVPAWDTIWAEDGQIFLSGALVDSLGSFTERYQGYMLFLPRAIASLAAALPLEYAAVVIAVVSSLVVALVALFVYVASSAVFALQFSRVALAIFVVLLPAAGLEVIANAANLHWYLLYASFWALVWRSEAASGLVIRSVVVGLSALTDPLAALFMPLAAVAAYRRRTVRGLVVPTVFVIALVLQGLIVLGGEGPQRFARFDPTSLLEIFALRVTGPILVGDRFLDDAWLSLGRIFAYGALVTVVAVLVYGFARFGRATRMFTALSCSYAVAFFVVPLAVRGTGEMDPVPGQFTLFGSRYVVLPFLFLVTALLLVLEDHTTRTRTRSAVAVVAFALGVVLVISNYPVTNLRSNGPAWKAELDKADAFCVASDAPTVRIPVPPGGPWAVTIPCDRLE